MGIVVLIHTRDIFFVIFSFIFFSNDKDFERVFRGWSLVQVHSEDFLDVLRSEFIDLNSAVTLDVTGLLAPEAGDVGHVLLADT